MIEEIILLLDKDVSNYLGIYYPKDMIDVHMRIQGFLSERLSTIFFEHNFKRVKIFPNVKFKKDLSYLAKNRKKKNEKKTFSNINKLKSFFLLLILVLIVLIIKIRLIFIKNINGNK